MESFSAKLSGFFSCSLIALVVGVAAALLLGKPFIKWLHRLKFGQEIREEGPQWHQKKSGTPTMGGIIFILAALIAAAVTLGLFAVRGNFDAVLARCILIFAVSLAFGLIGFTDDFIKVKMKRNLGLTAAQKFILQVLFAAAYVFAAYAMGSLNTDVQIPFTSIVWTMPIWLYIPFVIFVIVGVVNAVNLTDGLDGLASGVTSVCMLFFALVSYLIFEETGITVFAMALLGGLIGFLFYNKYPARVFMGDTGSLFLGAAVALCAVDMAIPIHLILIGIIYFAETVSVIMQTAYFKYTKKKYGEGRRIFKMTPVHHHFEMCGWSEKKIVFVFMLVTVIGCALAALGI